MENRLIAALIFLGTFSVVAATAKDYGVTWDVPSISTLRSFMPDGSMICLRTSPMAKSKPSIVNRTTRGPRAQRDVLTRFSQPGRTSNLKDRGRVLARVSMNLNPGDASSRAL